MQLMWDIHLEPVSILSHTNSLIQPYAGESYERLVSLGRSSYL